MTKLIKMIIKTILILNIENVTFVYFLVFFLDSDLEGSMNAVWDRGSLVAINREDRQR